MGKPIWNQYRIPQKTLLAAMLIATTGCTYTGRISVPSGPIQSHPAATETSTSPAISEDGNVVAYVSEESTLVDGDTNGVADVFIRSGHITQRINVTPSGGESAMAAYDPVVSDDGRYVVFVSEASDLIAGDTNGVADVFIRDLANSVTQRVSLTSAGGESAGTASAPAVSGDGRYVLFVSDGSDLVAGDTNGVEDVFVRDLIAGTTSRVSVKSNGGQANGASTAPSISYSGEWVAFASTATNLVSGDSNGVSDVFLASREGGNTRRVSIPDSIDRPFQQSNGASTNPKVTDTIDGYTGGGEPLVVYESVATNLTSGDNNSASDVFASTWVFGFLGSTSMISDATQPAHTPDIGMIDGGPGYVITYVSGTPGVSGDVVAVVRNSPVDDSSSETVVTRAEDGSPANGASGNSVVSGDGRYVAFQSRAGNLRAVEPAFAIDSIYVTRALQAAVDEVDPPRVGLLETRDLTILGQGFDATSFVGFDKGVTVNSTTFVSSEELVANVTVDTAYPGEAFRTLYVASPGVAGGLAGAHTVTCIECVEIAAVVEQPGSVDIQITGGRVDVGTFGFDLPGCVLGQCTALGATVSADGELTFGLDSLELDPIEVPAELFQGVEVTLELVPKFVAPHGQVIPANGNMELGFGIAIGIKHSLLPSSCALGPVQAELSIAGGVPYDQSTGEAQLNGGFTQELAITGCGFFTSTLNTLFSLPIEIGESSVLMNVRMDPVLTGTVIP